MLQPLLQAVKAQMSTSVHMMPFENDRIFVDAFLLVENDVAVSYVAVVSDQNNRESRTSSFRASRAIRRLWLVRIK